MMAWNSALIILLVEGLAVMVILFAVVFFRSRNRRAREMAEIERFIGWLGDDDALKSRLLETILIENCGIPRETAAVTLGEVNDAERALLQRIIQLFLQRDLSLLSEIEQLIANLSDPYCKLLAEGASGARGATAVGSETVTGNKAAGLERINQQLVRQLETAMQTIDEITAEYTRVFSGNQTALELENSSKKMQQIFHDVEQQIKANMSELQG